MIANWENSSRSVGKFRRALLGWYEANKRVLPWRGERDPYKVWISEIMLQQTRVRAVEARYARFLQRFPNVRALARARGDAVLAEWSGLGYYQRARNLHAAAKKLVASGGRFPRTASKLRSLPGIGRYTAAAIASIAFREPVAVVDGNVERVLARLLGARLRNPWQTALRLVDGDRPGDFNQAMMELGATVCLPNGEPECARCPVLRFCATRGKEYLSRPKATRKQAHATYLVAQQNGRVLLVKRPRNAALMPGMWELPRTTSHRRKAALFLRHSITTTDYRISVVLSDAKGGSRLPRAKWHKISSLGRLPLTGLASKIFKRVLQA